jgi:hypothetical protein
MNPILSPLPAADDLRRSLGFAVESSYPSLLRILRESGVTPQQIIDRISQPL